MCCSDDRNLTTDISFIFMSIGRTNDLIKQLKSVRLLPLVKLLDPSKLAIIVCSIKSLGETLDQKVLVLCTAYIS